MAGLNERLEQEKDIRLAIRIGIHTGLVMVGEIGKGAKVWTNPSGSIMC